MHYLHIFIIYIFFLTACASYPAPDQRNANAVALAQNHHFVAKNIQTDVFHLQSFYRFEQAGNKELTVYIEGDGFAWVTRSQPSFDPTPIKPTVLQMAVQHEQANVAYLARPCQYTRVLDEKACAISLWTDARFSEMVVAAMNEALSELKLLAGAKQLRLVGYSGGGAVAVLVAARRSDVAGIVTVAGNINPVLWVEEHHISPLEKSLDPLSVALKVAPIPQVHFSGAADTNITPNMASTFKQASGNPSTIELITIPKFTHGCCWAEQWPELLQKMNN